MRKWKKKLILDLSLALLGPNLISIFFFFWGGGGFTYTRCCILLQAIIVCNFKENKWTKLEKMTKNLVSGPILSLLAWIWTPKFFSWIFPLLDLTQCCKLSFYAISRKTNKPNLRKLQKNLVLSLILVCLPKFAPQKSFPRVLPLLDVEQYCKLSLHAISSSNIEQNLRTWQKPSFRHNFCPFGPNLWANFIFQKSGFVSH